VLQEQQKDTVRNQFSAEEHMNRNKLCSEVSADTWKSTST